MTTSQPPYNPLAKINLAKSIEMELLNRPVDPLSDVDRIVGAGVYVLYYSGSLPIYAPIASGNQNGIYSKPIYVGKAIPKGGRKGGFQNEASATGKAIADRLRQHAVPISEASNLDIADFRVRHLVVEDIWIPLGENMLIETFKPVWNLALDGFGNKDPGMRRATQYKSPWDTLHTGRSFAKKLADLPASKELLIQRIEDHWAGRPLARLPAAVLKQEDEERAEAEEIADEV
jgi:hypothetical protein